MTQVQMTPEINVLGVYRVLPTEESITEAARYHDYDWLLDEDQKYTDEIDWSNHDNLGLVELQVFGDISPADLFNSISQEDQVPYMEFWTDSGGCSLISEEESVTTEGRRACFFLHFVDHTKPLIVSEKQLKLPSWSALPERLTPYTHYLPVD